MTTLNSSNRVLIWQCKKEHGRLFSCSKSLYFFNKLVLGGMSFNNQHLLNLDGHGNHVTLEVIEQAKEFGLDMITLPSYTSHTLQPLNVSCFTPLKITFKKVRDVIMFINNHIEPDKIAISR
jgi:hypothetical protein